MALLLPPPPISSFQPVSRSTSLAYERFMQEPYQAANYFDHLQSNGGNFTEWVAFLNRVLCIAFNSEILVDDSPSLLENHSPAENCTILHFIDASIPPNFALCIGIIPSHTLAKKILTPSKPDAAQAAVFKS
ncbi:hypothetical protein O181_018457 [Austropuccinia psidii MF-1]|uniref:Uncharacterized protein n=1 Tax=Austropuccinia psidii MF-1 TaxID=1389203 RepID=A0A9Q3C9M3_9BASI|nr:hypothetical protein [Austropuccinia psidii MF-1]